MRKIHMLTVIILLFFFSGSPVSAGGCDLNKAENLLKSGKFKEAAVSYINCANLEELNDKSDSELIYKWYKEASYCYFAAEDMNRALKTMEEALAWAKRNGNKRETAESHFNKGTILVRLRLLRDAVYSTGKALSVFREIESSDGIVRALNMIASIKLKMEKFSEAKSLLQNSLRICEEKGLDQEKNEITRLLGDVLFQEGSFDDAEKNYMKSLKNYQSMGDNENAGHIYEKLGDLNKKKKSFDKAFEFYTKSESSFEKAGTIRKQIFVKFKTAFYYYNKGEFEKVREFYSPYIPQKGKKKKSNDIKIKTSKELLYFVAIGMGDLEKELKNYKRSLEYYLKALDAGFVGYKIEDEISLLVKIAESLAFSGDYENALAFYQTAESKLTDLEGVKLKTDLYIKKGELASGYRLYDSAINFYEDALSLNRDNPDVKSRILTMIGEIYFFKNDLILSGKMFKSAQALVLKMTEKAIGKEKEQLRILSGKIDSFLFMTGFEKSPLKSLAEFAGKGQNSDSSVEDYLIKKLKGASLLFYKTVYGSGDIFGNVSKSTALVLVNGNRVKGYRINHGNVDIERKDISLKTLISLALNKRKDKLEYLLDSYKTLLAMKEGKKKDQLELLAAKQLFNILVRPCLNDLNGSNNLILISDSDLLKGLDFKNLHSDERKFGEMFSVERKELSFLLSKKEK